MVTRASLIVLGSRGRPSTRISRRASSSPIRLPAPVIHRTPEEIGLRRMVVAETSREEQTQRIRDEAEYQRQRREAAQMHREVERRKVRMAPKVVMGPEMIEPEKREPMKEETMDETREAVKKLGGTMTDVALGEQLGVSGSRVAQLRKDLGIAAAKRGAKPKTRSAAGGHS
jgi:glycerol-3-phosphate O-acyltransferase